MVVPCSESARHFYFSDLLRTLYYLLFKPLVTERAFSSLSGDRVAFFFDGPLPVCGSLLGPRGPALLLLACGLWAPTPHLLLFYNLPAALKTIGGQGREPYAQSNSDCQH